MGGAVDDEDIDANLPVAQHGAARREDHTLSRTRHTVKLPVLCSSGPTLAPSTTLLRVPPAVDAPPLEVEWQFDALDLRPVERFLAAVGAPSAAARAGFELRPGPARRLHDIYFDSADWRIGRAGLVLRLRHQGKATVATMKDLAEATDGLRSRIEIEERLEETALPNVGGGPVTSRVRALLGAAALNPVLEVRTRRRPFFVERDGVRLGEVTLDETAITSATLRRPLRLTRVEVEIADPDPSAFEGFVRALREECGLQPASLSKFEAGLLAAGLSIPGPTELPDLEVGPDATLGELAFAALRDDTNEIRRREAGTRLGEDPEELHKMRVATRRLRAALTLFADALPVRAAQLEGEVGWLARELGHVRDLDVQLAQLTTWRAETRGADEEGLAELAATLEQAHDVARRELLAALDSRRYARLLAGLSQMLAAPPPRRLRSARTPCAVGLPELLAARQEMVSRAAKRARRSGVPSDFHRLRIRCKRLRYALDFASRSYGNLARRYTRQLADLQDELGKMQDAVVAAERLRAAALSGTGELSLGAVFAIGGIAERYRHEAEGLLAHLAEDSKVVNGAQWKRLAAAMDRQRVAADAAYEADRPRPRLRPAGDQVVARAVPPRLAVLALPADEAAATLPTSR
jgi:triphosphatase